MQCFLLICINLLGVTLGGVRGHTSQSFSAVLPFKKFISRIVSS